MTASKAANYTLTSTALSSTDGMSLNLSGITTANLTATGSGHSFTVGGWTGSGLLTGTAATVTASKSFDYTLTNSSLSSTDGMSLALSGITIATLTATGSGHNFTVSGWTGTGSLTGTAATVTDAASGGFTLANTQLIAPNTTLTLSGITSAKLTDTSAGGKTFTVTGWTGSGSLTGTADTVTASKSADYTLTNALLSSTDGMSLGLNGITTANLTATGSGHNFTVSGWTGTGSLTGAAAAVTDAASGGFTLTNTSLIAPNTTMTLSGITTANLTDTGSGNTFTVSGWTHGGTLAGTADTVTASKSANYTLTNSSLSSSDGMSLSLSGITTANLTATGSGHSFTVSGWTGSGSLTGTTATVTASKSADYTLTNTLLSSTDGMSLALSGITTAKLTATGSGHTFTVSGWTGTGSLTGTAATVTDAASGGFTLTNTKLIAPNTTLTLSGITTANLTDTGSGNTFTVTGWTGTGSLTGTVDTVTASKNANYTLTNTLLSSTDGMSLGLSGITTANLTATGSGHSFTVSGWTAVGLAGRHNGDRDGEQERGYTLTNAALSSTDGMSLVLSGITTANLTDTGSGHTFTVSGWTHGGTLTGTLDIVAASKAANYSLTNTALSSTDGLSLALSGITTANLTATGGGHPFTVSRWTGSGSLTGTAATVTASESADFTLTNSSLTSADHVAGLERHHDRQPDRHRQR